MKVVALALAFLAVCSCAPHDRHLENEIMNDLEDEREAMNAGKVEEAREKYDAAMKLMNDIKSQDFEVDGEKPAEKAVEPEAKAVEPEAKADEPEAKAVEPEAKAETEDNSAEFTRLRSTMRDALQKVKTHSELRTQAEGVLQKHNALLDQLKAIKAGPQSSVDKKIIAEMVDLNGELSPITEEATKKDLEAQKAKPEIPKATAGADMDLEKEGDDDEFANLKQAVRSQLDKVKNDKTLRGEAEEFLKKHHELLTTLKDLKSGKSSKKPASLVKELKEMKEELEPVTNKVGGSTEKQVEKATSSSKKTSAKKTHASKKTHDLSRSSKKASKTASKKASKKNSKKHTSKKANRKVDLERSSRIQKEINRIDSMKH